AGDGLTDGGTVGVLTLNIGAGSGITVNANNIEIDVSTSGAGVLSSSNSGLELTSDGVRLLGGCGNDEILSWNEGSSIWECTSVSGLGGITGSGVATQVAFFKGTNEIGGNSNLWWNNTLSRLGIGLS